MTFHLGNNFPRIVMKNEREEFAQGCSVGNMATQNRGSVFAPGNMLRCGVRWKPSVLAKNGHDVTRCKRVHGRYGCLKTIRGMHQEDSSPAARRCALLPFPPGRKLKGQSIVQRETSVATTCAAMASPRPIASTPSLVFAFRCIFSVGTPSAFASASRIFGKCGPN